MSEALTGMFTNLFIAQLDASTLNSDAEYSGVFAAATYVVPFQEIATVSTLVG